MYMVHQLPASHNQPLCFLKANTQTKEKKKTHLKKKILSQFQVKIQIKTLNTNKIRKWF